MLDKIAAPAKSPRHRRLKKFLIGLSVIVVLLILATVGIWHVYEQDLRPVSQSEKSQVVTINSGTSVNQIAAILYKDGLVRSAW
ncbi:MAG: hypothetical protein ACREGF_03180, partial [Candidatus Saccharimonadales bacterium]